MEFQSGEWIDVYRELLPLDDWQELVRIQVTQHSYPFEVKVLERPLKQKTNIDDLSDWTVLSHATFPLEVVFCGRGTLDDEDSIHAMTLNDTNWQAVFEDRLLHLLNRKEITSGFLPTNYSKPSQRTLENFMTEFMLTIPYNFILTRDATGRFGMFDHFCTNEKIAHFGNIDDIQHA